VPSQAVHGTTAELPDATGGGGSGAVPAHAQREADTGLARDFTRKGAAGCAPAACEVNAAADGYQREEAVRKPRDGVKALRRGRHRSESPAGRGAAGRLRGARRSTSQSKTTGVGSSACELHRHRASDSVYGSGLQGGPLAGRSPAKRKRV